MKQRIFTAALLLAFCGLGADWPQFRGPNRDGISSETGLLRSWPEGGPELLWSTPVGQGYSAAAIHGGKVFFNDYDEAAGEWLVRSVDLETGRELWRFREARRIRPNHGITRTITEADVVNFAALSWDHNRLHTDAQETQRSHQKYGVRKAQRGLNRQDRLYRGLDFLEQDPAPRFAPQTRCLDVAFRLHGQHHAAHHAGDNGRVNNGNHQQYAIARRSDCAQQ